MSDRAEKLAWVARVLGVQAEDSATSGEDIEAGDFESELLAWRLDMLQQAKRLSDPDARSRIEGLGDEAASLLANGKLGAAASLLDAMGTALAEAQRTASIRSAAVESGHKVDYAKLLLRWREAQATTRQRIQDLGRQILADPEVIDDPRYEEVEEVVADLMSVMPEFGAKLETLMDGLENISDPVARAEQVKHARDEIDACQAVLDDAEELTELSDFASAEYGGIDLVGELRDSLIELAGTLAEV